MSRLVLIGGTAGTGKSTAARAVAGRLGAAWLQLDTLWIATRDAAPAGSDERLRLDIDSRIRSRTDPLDELVQHHIAASAAVCAALPHALAFELQTHPVVVAAIGRGLSVRLLVRADEAIAHFGWLGGFFGMDVTASSDQTRRLPGWAPTGPTLLEDLDAGAYFRG